MTTILEYAIAAIKASADRASAIELDTRVRYLRSVCEATRIEFTEAHIGLAGGEHIAAYQNSADAFRHRRASILLRARRNHLVGAKIERMLENARRVRSEERLVASLSRMALESAEGRIGATPIERAA